MQAAAHATAALLLCFPGASPLLMPCVPPSSPLVPQMNMADSERMAGALESAGYTCSEDPADAEVLIYNTCSIRAKAENKVYSALGGQVCRMGGSQGSHACRG